MLNVGDAQANQEGVEAVDGERGEVGGKEGGQVGEGTQGLLNEMGLAEDGAAKRAGRPVILLLRRNWRGETRGTQSELGNEVQQTNSLGVSCDGVGMEVAAIVK